MCTDAETATAFYPSSILGYDVDYKSSDEITQYVGPRYHFNRILPKRWSNKLILPLHWMSQVIGVWQFFSKMAMSVWVYIFVKCFLMSTIRTYFLLLTAFEPCIKIDKLQNIMWYYIPWITNLRPYYIKVTYYSLEINEITHLLYGTWKQDNMIQILDLFVLLLFSMIKRKIICNLLSDTLYISNELLKGNLIFHNLSSLSV